MEYARSEGAAPLTVTSPSKMTSVTELDENYDAAATLLQREPSRVSMFSVPCDVEVTVAITKRDFAMSHSPAPVELPESVYGAAMMAIIRSSQSYHGVVHCVTACLVGALVLNIVIQFYVLVCANGYICAPAVAKVRDLYAEYHREVFEDGKLSQELWESFGRTDELCQMPLSQPWFFLAILGIWTATCWVDMLESFRYLFLWAGLPSAIDGQSTEVVADGDDVVIVRASRLVKAVAIATISIPKLTIIVLLWWLGARWLVATTSFQSLLLNAVALAFITELDELIFLCLVPESMKAMAQTFKIFRPPVIVRQETGMTHEQAELLAFVRQRDRRLVFTVGRMVLTLLVVVGFPVLYMRVLQQVLPDYKWDVHRPCEKHLLAMTGA